MDFFNSLKEGFTKTANKAIKVSNEVVEITKLNFAISDVNSSIDKKLKEIGDMVYKSYTKNESISDEISEKCSEIDKAYEELESLKAKIRTLKKIKVCPKCSEDNVEDSNFCKKCGEPLN